MKERKRESERERERMRDNMRKSIEQRKTVAILLLTRAELQHN